MADSVAESVDYDHTPSLDFDLQSLDSQPLQSARVASKNESEGITTHLTPKTTGAILHQINNRLQAQNNHIYVERSQMTSPMVINNETNNGNKNNTKQEDKQATKNLDNHLDLIEKQKMIPLSKLNTLHLYDCNINSLNEIRNLDKAIHLTELNLHANNIFQIESLNNLINLKILDLSSNQIECIENLNYLINLEELNLSSNRIQCLPIKCLKSQNRLNKLLLSYNFINDLSGLSEKYFQKEIKKLRYLDIKGNRIDNINQIKLLKHLSPSLQHLILQDKNLNQSNPVCKKNVCF